MEGQCSSQRLKIYSIYFSTYTIGNFEVPTLRQLLERSTNLVEQASQDASELLSVVLELYFL